MKTEIQMKKKENIWFLICWPYTVKWQSRAKVRGLCGTRVSCLWPSSESVIFSSAIGTVYAVITIIGRRLMEQLPEVVKAAITAACNSGRILSWKVQEDGRGTLIQLVWKPVCADTKVCSNWNARKNSTDLTTSGKLNLKSWLHLVLAGMLGAYKPFWKESRVHYGVPFVSKLFRHRCLAQGSMFIKGIDV